MNGYTQGCVACGHEHHDATARFEELVYLSITRRKQPKMIEGGWCCSLVCAANYVSRLRDEVLASPPQTT